MGRVPEGAPARLALVLLLALPFPAGVEGAPAPPRFALPRAPSVPFIGSQLAESIERPQPSFAERLWGVDCHTRALASLGGDCSKLSQERKAWLALALTNCQLQLQGEDPIECGPRGGGDESEGKSRARQAERPDVGERAAQQRAEEVGGEDGQAERDGEDMDTNNALERVLRGSSQELGDATDKRPVRDKPAVSSHNAATATASPAERLWPSFGPVSRWIGPIRVPFRQSRPTLKACLDRASDRSYHLYVEFLSHLDVACLHVQNADFRKSAEHLINELATGGIRAHDAIQHVLQRAAEAGAGAERAREAAERAERAARTATEELERSAREAQSAAAEAREEAARAAAAARAEAAEREARASAEAAAASARAERLRAELAALGGEAEALAKAQQDARATHELVAGRLAEAAQASHGVASVLDRLVGLQGGMDGALRRGLEVAAAIASLVKLTIAYVFLRVVAYPFRWVGLSLDRVALRPVFAGLGLLVVASHVGLAEKAQEVWGGMRAGAVAMHGFGAAIGVPRALQLWTGGIGGVVAGWDATDKTMTEGGPVPELDVRSFLVSSLGSRPTGSGERTSVDKAIAFAAATALVGAIMTLRWALTRIDARRQRRSEFGMQKDYNHEMLFTRNRHRRETDLRDVAAPPQSHRSTGVAFLPPPNLDLGWEQVLRSALDSHRREVMAHLRRLEQEGVAACQDRGQALPPPQRLASKSCAPPPAAAALSLSPTASSWESATSRPITRAAVRVLGRSKVEGSAVALACEKAEDVAWRDNSDEAESHPENIDGAAKKGEAVEAVPTPEGKAKGAGRRRSRA